MRDSTECLNLIGYAFIAVIIAIFSNQNDLEMIMNYILKYKSEKKTRYDDRALTRNLQDSGQAIHPLCYEFSL